MITKQDLEKLKQKIMENKKLLDTFIQVQKENGKIERIPVKIVINPKAKIKWIKNAVPITVDEIWQQIKDKETYEEQQEAIGRYVLKAKSFYETVVKTKESFNGKFIEVK